MILACCESGRVHCKDCGAGRKNMHTEGIHTEACRTAFSRCCIAANEHDSCSIGGSVFVCQHAKDIDTGILYINKRSG